MSVIKGKDVSSYRLPWPPWKFLWHCLIFWSHCLKNQTSGAIFTISSMPMFMLNQYMDWCTRSLVFSIPVCFTCSCFSSLSCSTVCIILLSIIAMPSMIASSSQNDQYGCRSFYTKAMVNGQPQSMSSNSMHMCLSFSIANLMSSVSMQSGMSIHDSIALMVMHMPGISSSPFVLWLCLNS